MELGIAHCTLHIAHHMEQVKRGQLHLARVGLMLPLLVDLVLFPCSHFFETKV
jgi:hypothetical protein